MHYALDELPDAAEFDGMMAAHTEFPEGADIDGLLEGLPDDLCPSPHWGYVLEGRAVIQYGDGSRETVSAGDVYYFKPHHTAVIEEDFEAVEFSPTHQFRPVMEHMAQKKD